jgi:hypothetical protein
MHKRVIYVDRISLHELRLFIEAGYIVIIRGTK